MDLHVKVAFEDWEIDHKRVAFTLDDILGEDLVSTRVIKSAIVVLWWQDVSLYLVICQLACIEIDCEVFLKLFHFDIILNVLEESLVADGNFGVD